MMKTNLRNLLLLSWLYRRHWKEYLGLNRRLNTPKKGKRDKETTSEHGIKGGLNRRPQKQQNSRVSIKSLNINGHLQNKVTQTSQLYQKTESLFLQPPTNTDHCQ